MLAWFAAAVSLWLGARQHDSAFARGYRWLAGAAALYCAGLITQQVLGSALSPESGLSFADLPPLLAVAAAAVGIVMLATAEREGEAGRASAARGGDGANPLESATTPVLPGLADGYVMAVALLVIGWVTLFSTEFHRSGERPGTFLLALIHPLADLAVLGALLPMVTTAWRRVMLPYLALVAVLVGDALAVGQRALGGHPGVAAQLLGVVAAVLLGAAPWRVAETSWTRRASSSAAATIIAALTAAVATVVVIANGLAGAPASGAALVVAGGAGVLVLAVRVFMLVNQNGIILGIWRESSRSLRELASRTSDVVLVCDLERRHQLRQPRGRGLRVRARRPVRAAAAGLRAPRGPGRRAHRVPARAGRLSRRGPGPRGRCRRRRCRRRQGRRRQGRRPGHAGRRCWVGRAVPGPGARRRRHVAARRVDRAALPGPRRAAPDPGHRPRRQRPGGAAPAGRAPDLPRRADRPA